MQVSYRQLCGRQPTRSLLIPDLLLVVLVVLVEKVKVPPATGEMQLHLHLVRVPAATVFQCMRQMHQLMNTHMMTTAEAASAASACHTLPEL